MKNNDSKIYFIFGVHNHQPVGNFSSVFNEAFSKCYLPFLSILEKFPRLKVVIHNSGALYDWAAGKIPDWTEQLKKLIKKGQIELTGGGYYEPIFPIITQEDRIGQVQLMNRYLKEVFGSVPRGCWIPERVWEPSLAKTLNQCGFYYTYLDEANFYQKKESNNLNLYLSEDQGHPLSLFVIDQLLAEKIPFAGPQEVFDILLSYRKKGIVLVTFFSDGEKFGLWPGTYNLIQKEKWLERFFTLLQESSQVETILAQEAAEKFSQKKLIYIQASSYPKMQSWALSYQKRLVQEELISFLAKNKESYLYEGFIKGENFKNFFIKYPRLNFMHKRMLWLSRRVNSLLKFKENKDVFLNLWKAQANCVYWHGLFGGFYLPHLRQACYKYLIKTEILLGQKCQSKKLLQKDFDFDSQKEIIVQDADKFCVFSRRGGTLDELSLKKVHLNLINTIERKKEPYHRQIKKKEHLRHLIYDNYKKTAWLDHLLPKNLNLENFKKGKGIFSLTRKIYSFEKAKNQKDDSFDFFCREKEISFKKRFSLGPNRLKASYQLAKKNALNNFCFGIECNLSLSDSSSLVLAGEEKKKLNFAQGKDLGLLNSLVIFDRAYRLKLNFNFKQFRVFVNPVYTVSSSEFGQDVVFQQLSLLFILNFPVEDFFLELKIEG